ncbi:hypothetical protein [Streptomyces sp. NPDC048191]
MTALNHLRRAALVVVTGVAALIDAGPAFAAARAGVWTRASGGSR